MVTLGDVALIQIKGSRSVFGTHEKFVNGKKIEVAVGLAASSNHRHMA
jgi:hypothetical protein